MEKIENEKTEIQNLTEEIKILNDFLKEQREEKEKIKEEKEKKLKENLEKTKNNENQDIIRNENNIIENQFFKDLEPLNLNFEYRKIIDWENTYILVDNSKFNNYVINKINEFTTFFYITIFFLFIILTFNFIKNILWK